MASHVIKYGYTTRELVFKDGGKVKISVQRYKCKKCGKTFQTDLSTLVPDNSNFTYRVREVVLADVAESLNSTYGTVFNLGNYSDIEISHQTVQRFINNVDKDLHTFKGDFSGYYVFDVEWVKINSVWFYFFLIIDALISRVIAYRLYDKETKGNVKEFLCESIPMHKRGYITTDLDKKYGPVIEELGFKHQLCYFHFLKNCRKSIREYSNAYFDSENMIANSYKELDDILSVFDSEDYGAIEEYIGSLIYRLDDFTPVMQKVLKVPLCYYYKKHLYCFKDENVERTSNKIENCFQKIMPRFKKKIYRTKEGFLSRVHLKIINWNQKRTKTQ